MIISLASGKGGTGKIFYRLSCSFIVNKVIVDCDVDAANLHLILHPKN